MTRQEKEVALNAVEACYNDAREMFDGLDVLKNDEGIGGECLSDIYCVLDTAQWMASALSNALFAAKKIMREQIKEDDNE